jgi:hypothetical protein
MMEARPAFRPTGPGMNSNDYHRSSNEGMTVEVPNIMNAVEVSKFYQGPDMKSIGV